MDSNPVRIAVEEVAGFVPIDFLVNVVLDEKKEVIKAVAGHPVLAHREGCRFLDKLYKVVIRGKADIVIVSAGGYPKDLNLYQSQKALDNVRHAIRPGGIVIWVARSQEGLGDSVFEEGITTAKSPDAMEEAFKYLGDQAQGMVMPFGGSTLPVLKHEVHFMS